MAVDLPTPVDATAAFEPAVLHHLHLVREDGPRAVLRTLQVEARRQIGDDRGRNIVGDADLRELLQHLRLHRRATRQVIPCECCELALEQVPQAAQFGLHFGSTGAGCRIAAASQRGQGSGSLAFGLIGRGDETGGVERLRRSGCKIGRREIEIDRRDHLDPALDLAGREDDGVGALRLADLAQAFAHISRHVTSHVHVRSLCSNSLSARWP